jgi:hypothetical protein
MVLLEDKGTYIRITDNDNQKVLEFLKGDFKLNVIWEDAGYTLELLNTKEEESLKLLYSTLLSNLSPEYSTLAPTELLDALVWAYTDTPIPPSSAVLIAMQQVVVVRTLADFPELIGDTITLQGNTLYLLDTSELVIDIPLTFVLLPSTGIRGLGAMRSKIRWTASPPTTAFDASDSSFSLEGLTLINDTGAEATLLDAIADDTQTINISHTVIEAFKLGVIEGYGHINITNNLFEDCYTLLLNGGSECHADITDNYAEWSAPYGSPTKFIETAATATFDKVTISGNTFHTVTNLTAITVPDTTNMELLEIVDNSTYGAGALINAIPMAGNLSILRNLGAFGYMAECVYNIRNYATSINFNTTYQNIVWTGVTADIANLFTVEAATGKITYTGLRPIAVDVRFSGSIQRTGGGGDFDVRLALDKNNAGIGSATVAGEFGALINSGNDTPVSGFRKFTLNPNDTISLMVRSESGARTINFNFFQISVLQR